MAQKYAFFLGCIAPLRYPGVEKSTREVCKALDIELVELEDASCCPAPGVIRAFNKKTWLAAAARNLALAEAKGVPIVTVCNGCYGTLFDAAHELNGNEEALAEVNEVLAKIGMHYNGTTQVRHFAEVLYNEVGAAKIKEKVDEAVANGVKAIEYPVAVFYGCHFLKPSAIKDLDDPENPHLLEDLVAATGAKPMPREQGMLCCGAGGGLKAAFGDVSMQFTKTNLENMQKSGAKYIIDVCPFCHLQFDGSQKELGFNFPVLHLSQLTGLALGMSEEDLGLSAHITPVVL